MKFGPVPVSGAEGAIAAHSLRLKAGVIKKGTQLTAELVARLRDEGVTEVVAARLESGDVHEDEAARRIAAVLRGGHVRLDEAGTGRCNLYAEEGGLFVVDRGAVDTLNRLDPGLTVATLAEFAPVEAGRMVATVKIIPFALPESVVSAAEKLDRATLSVAPWTAPKVGLAATMLPGLKPSVMDKTRRILEDRLKPAGGVLLDEIRVPHDAQALAGALQKLRDEGADLLIAFGASAITDRADVIPAAIEAAGGSVKHFGMPVDPGNLLLLGEIDGRPVLGAPGCARSPAENGFDWVLNRLLAGLAVKEEDITGLGVGGLLMEIVSRPQPREPVAATSTSVAAIILAAGRSSRMGGPNKLMAAFGGQPLVRRIAEHTLASTAGPVIVVTGHRAGDVAGALSGLDLRIVHNPDFADGLATSLKAELAEVPSSASGVLVLLADMPNVTAGVIDRLVGAFQARKGAAIVLPTFNGKRGNPVLWPRAFFPELIEVSGDTGARHILARHEDAVERVEIGAAASVDVDTPEALAAGGVLREIGVCCRFERGSTHEPKLLKYCNHLLIVLGGPYPDVQRYDLVSDDRGPGMRDVDFRTVFLGDKAGYGLATANILYHLPERPKLLQSFVWQFYDVAPDYPRLMRFLDFWLAEIDGIIHSVEVAHRQLVREAEIRHARFHGQLH